MRSRPPGRPTGLPRILAFALLLSGCSAGNEQPAPPVAEVEAMTVRAQDVPNIVEVPGRVEAVRTAEVRARVNGIVQRRLYEEGSRVSAGAVLFRIDPSELNASLSAVQATLARARAEESNARRDVTRYQGLIRERAISQQEYDTAVARLRTAEADVAQAQAQVRSSRLNLGYASVTAPISGQAGRAQVTEGALVSAAEGTLLTRIEQIDPVYVNFSQSSSNLLGVRRAIASGQLRVPPLERIPVQLTLEDGSDYGIAGHVDFLELTVNEQTGTSALRAEFPNPANLLLPGQFVRARIIAGTRPDGILVPQRAVQLSADGASVMVLDKNDTPEQRRVELGSLSGKAWIIRSGLRSGERIIVNGLQKVRPGQRVRVVGAPARAEPAARPGGPAGK